MSSKIAEPRRLLSHGSHDGAELSSLGRSLLLAGRARREPAGARERVWGSIAIAGAAAGVATGAALLPGAAGAGAGGAGAAASKGAGVAAALATKAKLLILTAVVASAAATGTAAVVVSRTMASDAVASPSVRERSSSSSHPSKQGRQAASPPLLSAQPSKASAPLAAVAVVEEPSVHAEDLPTPPTAPVVIASPSSKSVSVAPTPKVEAKSPRRQETNDDVKRASNETASTAADVSQQPVTTIATTDAEKRASELRVEADLLAAARADLARGDAASATRRIGESKTRFPNGLLIEEREALEVRAVYASGDHRRAGALARTFLERHPKSPSRSSIEPIAK